MNENINMVQRIEEIKTFFTRESMYKVMKATLNFVLRGKRVNFKLNIGGNSYSDGKNVVVGLPEVFFNANYKEIYIAILALLGHEGQHILSSNFDDFGIYNEEESKKLIQKGISARFAQNFVHSIGNIIEDGRIENILVNRLPGYIPKIKFLNMYSWNISEIKKETNEFQGLILSILTLSTLGIYPKNYNAFFKGSRMDSEINKIKPLISDGIKAKTCKDGLDVCRKIISILEPYIFELYNKDIKEKEELWKKLMNFLKNFQSEFHNSEETDLNESSEYSSHIKQQLSDKDDSSNDKFSSSGPSNSKEKNESQNPDEKDSLKSNGSTSENNEDNKNKKAELSSKNKEKADGNYKDYNNKEENDSGKNNYNNKNEYDNKNNNIKDCCNNGKNSNDTKLSPGAENKIDEHNDILLEEEINKTIKKISDELNTEIDEDFHKAEKDEKKKKEENKNRSDFELTKEEIQKISKKNGGYGFIEYPNDFILEYNLPNEIKVPAKAFRREVEKIFKNKSSININGQNKGILNPDDLYKVGLKNYNLFTIEGRKSRSDYVVYILRDGSGSMRGEKEIASAYALAIIEEGLKGIVPFKTVTFSAGSSNIMHYIIKNWEDKSSRNYAYNFLKHYRAGGCNEDDFSIRIAAKELLKRPEKDKILIVLSDGLPSSTINTKEAIAESRKEKIYLVGIMFGNENFRKNNYSLYKKMYQKNIIATSPKNIPNKLTKILKEILVR